MNISFIVIFAWLLAGGGQSPSPEEPKMCSLEVLLCPDGKTYVARDPAKDCMFKPCPDGSRPKEVRPAPETIPDSKMSPKDSTTDSTTRRIFNEKTSK